jgi:hypothetical protein
MSSRAIPMLEESRLAGVIEDVEAGRPVDVKRVETLQALDTARAGQLFLADALRREDEADEQFARQLREG